MVTCQRDVGNVKFFWSHFCYEFLKRKVILIIDKRCIDMQPTLFLLKTTYF